MRTLLVIVSLSAVLLVVKAQFEGRYYRPRPTLRARITDGRYKSSNDGRYKPSGDGKYRPKDDGKYRGGNDGKYTHKDVGGGQYKGGEEKYTREGQYTSGGEQYKGNDERYEGEGQYTGGGGQYTGSGGQYTGGGGQYTGDNGKKTELKDNSRQSDRSGLGIGFNQIRPNSASFSEPSALRPSVQGKGTGKGGSGWRIIRDVNVLDQDGYHYL